MSDEKQKEKAAAEAKAKKEKEEAEAKAKAEADAKAKAEADANDPERIAELPAEKPVSVRVYRTRDGSRRFYGEDWGDGKFIDRESGKQVEVFDKEVKIKVPDPENSDRMIPKTIIVKDVRLKGEKKD